MQTDPVKRYLTSSVKTPYFLFVSDDQYKTIFDELSMRGLDIVQMSSFCGNDDKLPDIDGLLNHIEEADVNAKSKKFFVTGLGEYLALRGPDEASRTLSRLKDLNVGGAKVVLLLRGLASQIPRLQADLRFDERRFSVIDKAGSDVSITLADPSVGLPALPGFKALLMELEDGRCGNVVVNTVINLDKAIFTVHHISNAYDGIKFST